ncbi:MAG TPA: hypothetical protein VFD39_07140 [Trueperaceae bacterium]|nr:hypothetical protein [Trueperaceae bacterium]
MTFRPRTILCFMVVLALAGSAFAGDWHLRLRLPIVTTVTDELPLADPGDQLYDTQESVHRTITKTTGVRVPHSYIWLHIGRFSVPVDPINFSR